MKHARPFLLLALAAVLMAPVSGSGMTLNTVTVSTTTIDVTGIDASFDCEVDVTGATSAGCVWKGPNKKPYTCISVAPVGNVFSCPITVPADSPATAYVLHHVFAANGTGTIVASKAEVDALGGAQTTVTATSTNEDTTAPTPSGFFIDPLSLDATTGGTVTCSVQPDATDTGTSIVAMACTFMDPSGDKKDANGNPFGCAGKSSCSFAVPAGSEAGYWLVDRVIARDAAGNQQSFTSTQVGQFLNGGNVTIDMNTSTGAACTRSADAQSTGGSIATSQALVDGTTVASEQLEASDVYVTSFVRASATGAQYFLADGAITDVAQAPVLVRFGASGNIEALDGSTWTNMGATPAYDTATWYAINTSIDVAAGTFDVDAQECQGGTWTPVDSIVDGASFQTGTSFTEGVTHYGVYGAGAVVADVTDTAWFVFAPDPDCSVTEVCGARDCGRPPDGCGGVLASCGTCTGGDTCGGGGTPYVCGQ